MGSEGASELGSVAPAIRRVRAFFAPVNRSTGETAAFDAASFDVDAPPAPWIDLGWCKGFARRCGTAIQPLLAGAPGFAVGQVRTEIDASVSVEFDRWGKVQMALCGGAQQINVLRAGAAAVGLSGDATASTATALDVGVSPAAGFTVGDVIAVDVDYTGQTGFVGSGMSGGYVRAGAAIPNDADYVRRVTLNVARVVGIGGGVLTLGAALPAGVPAPGMKVSRVVGFCDREGARFFAEWSGVFVLDGMQGDRVAFHYPRLQAMTGAAEKTEGLVGVGAGELGHLRLLGSFRALPVRDVTDGEMVVCFRSYVPGAMRAV